NCWYRMPDIEDALRRMDRTARRLAVVGLTSGPEPAHLAEIGRELGYRMRFSRRDYIHVVNVLYQVGIDAGVTIVPLSKTYTFASTEQAVDSACGKIRDDVVDRE